MFLPGFPCTFEDLNHSKDLALRGSLQTRLKYLGGDLDWKGDLTSEVHEHLRAAAKAWCAFGSFWNCSAVKLKFRVNVYKAVVRFALLVGLEAVALSIDMLLPLEKFQNKKMRQLLCGAACIAKGKACGGKAKRSVEA